MSTTISGNHTDYSFTRDGNTLKVIQKSNNSVVAETTDNLVVEFSDGTTVDLSQNFTTVAASSESSYFGTPSSTALFGGGYVLVWEYFGQQDGAEEGITLQQYDSSGVLLKETQLISGEAEDPTVTPKKDGGYIVAWSSESGSTSNIQIQQFNADGNASGKVQTVATSKTLELEDAVIAVLPDGRFVVTWISLQEGEHDDSFKETGDLYFQLFSATGVKSGGIQKVSSNSGDDVTPDDQVILPTSDGGFVIAFNQEENMNNNGNTQYQNTLFVRSFNANGSPKESQPSILQSLTSDHLNATYQTLLKTENGYLASWVGVLENGNNGQGRSLLVQNFNEQFQAVGAPIALMPGSGSSANDASLTQLSNGNYVAVWSTYESSPGNVTYAQILDENFSNVGDRIIVKNGSVSIHEAGVTALEHGKFVISWVMANDIFSNTGGASLHSQSYDANGNPAGNAAVVISGDENDNTIAWSDDHDVILQGNAGDDILSAGNGNDIFNGGSGNDTVIMANNLSANNFSAENGVLIIQGPAGKDALISVEQVQFNDATLTIDDGTVAQDSGDITGSGETPATAALADGSQVVAWKQGSEIMLQLFQEGAWRQPIPTGIEYERGSLGVATLGQGFIVTWGNYDGGPLFAQRYDASGRQVGDLIEQSPADASHVVDDINATQLADGSFVLSWTEETPDQPITDEFGTVIGFEQGEGQAYIQLHNADGSTKGNLISLSSGNLQAFEPSVSALKNGGFVVVWEYVNDAKESEEIYLQRFKADGTADGKALQVNTSTKGDQGDPEVVTLADGSYVVTWTRETDNDRKSTDQWGNPVVVEITTAIDIFTQRYSADGKKLGGETQVNKVSGFHNDPVITALKDGGYVIAWATSDERDIYNGESTLYAQIFDKNGARVGDQLVVAHSDDRDYFPSVSASADGGFLISWEASNRYNSNNRDVFTKKYDANGNSLILTGDNSDNTITWGGSSGVILDGGDGDDTLTGGDANDTLIGGSGNDRLDGKGGSNTLIGGNGNDTYIVSSTRNLIVEEANGGIDTVEASLSWTLGNHLEHLTLTGGDAINGSGNELDNILIGNAGKNILTGGAGNDTLDGGSGVDTLIGGTGDDTYVVDLIAKGTGAKANVALEDTITEKKDEGVHDKLTLRVSDDVLSKLEGATSATTLALGVNLEDFDASMTGALKLNLTGNADNNILIGNDADNVLNGGTGIDTLVGGKGDDTYVIDNLEELALVNILGNTIIEDDGNDTLRITLKGGTIANPSEINLSAHTNLTEVENVQIAGIGVFSVTGNDLDNILDSGKTANTLRGGLGDDTYVITHKDTVIIEEQDEGNDTIVSSFTLSLNNYANFENLTLSGKAAINGTGNALDNVLAGNDGANILDGSAGADRMAGGKGNDTYVVDDEGDVVIENANEGIDTIKASISFDLSKAENVENLTLLGSDNLSAVGNELANILTGNDGNNILDGGEGIDKLIGGKGDDTYIVDLIVKGTGKNATVALEDTITEKKGEGDHDTVVLRIGDEALSKLSESTKIATLSLGTNLENFDASGTGTLKLNLTGNAANNIITGNHAGNTLDGGAGNDTIIGGDGDDLIIGGLGTDNLTGGAGADLFRFASQKELGLDATQDVITDFNSSQGDKLELKFLKGWTFKGEIESNSDFTTTKQFGYVVDNGGLIIYGNSGGNTNADFSIKLVGVTDLTAGDFILS